MPIAIAARPRLISTSPPLSLAVENSALVAEYLRICPGLDVLATSLVDWIMEKSVKLSSYAVFMLAVFYLQVRVCATFSGGRH